MKTTLGPALATVLLLAGAARADVLKVPADFASIQAAVNAAQTGDEIVISAGSYEETVLLDGMTDVTLRGQGKVVLTGGAPGTAVVTVNGCTGVVVERLRFDQPVAAGVTVSGSTGTRVGRCRVESSAGNGINIINSAATAIERCQVLEPADSGVSCVASYTTLVSRCLVTGGGAASIVLSGTDDSCVDQCKLLQPGASGIVIGFPSDSLRCTVQRTLIVEPGILGIDVVGAFSKIRDNRIIRPANEGLLVEAGAAGCVLEDNRVTQAHATAVRVQEVTDFVRHNTVVKPGVFGFLVEEIVVSFADNVVVHSGDSAILLGPGMSVGKIAANRALKPGGNGYEIGGTGLLIHDNQSLGAGGDGFQLFGTGNTLVHNLALGSANFDFEDPNSEDNVYVDNTLSSANLQ